MPHIYTAWNAPMPTTAAMAKVTTGTSIKTMLQIATPATRGIQLISWGFTCDAVPSGIGQVELIQTDVAATVTAHVAAGVQPIDPGMPASLMTLGTSATGYTSTSEGSTTASRSFDNQFVRASNTGEQVSYVCQWMPDERPIIPVSKFLRVRATFAAAVNMLTFVRWME